ncbi:MAG: NAD(+) diphosphatase [Actinobacteria bacterium]|nr:NAD(+) diphosphatase [Actinomycetota bacterium]
MSASEMSGKPAGRLKNLTLARSQIDRASELRTDSAAMKKQWEDAKVLVVVGNSLSANDEELIYYSPRDFGDEGERYFLGLEPSNGQSYFAIHLPVGDERFSEEKLRTLRQVGANLSDLEAGLAVHAIALANWHTTHPCCSRCGAPTRVDLGGAVRICTADETQHHPRTDPAVIVLIRDNADRILLGHQPIWPVRRFSAFAGFVEPGESFEQCVEREVFEESGVKVHSVSYLGSQPWPFPASIMIAYEAITDDASTAKADGIEITEIRWFTRAEMKLAVESGEVLLPPRISVARRMIEHWYGAEIETDESWRP